MGSNTLLNVTFQLINFKYPLQEHYNGFLGKFNFTLYGSSYSSGHAIGSFHVSITADADAFRVAVADTFTATARDTFCLHTYAIDFAIFTLHRPRARNFFHFQTFCIFSS